MDERSVELFKRALQKGKYKSYFLRIMVIGHFGVGKTTLTKRLMRENVKINECNSTEGIDIYVSRCHYDSQKRTWNTDTSYKGKNMNFESEDKMLYKPHINIFIYICYNLAP